MHFDQCLSVGRHLSQMLLMLGWAQQLCNAEIRFALGCDGGDSSHYLDLLGRSWVRAGSVLRVRMQKERCGEKLFSMKTPFPCPNCNCVYQGTAQLTAGCVSPAGSFCM